jgi:hypothetical protein
MGEVLFVERVRACEGGTELSGLVMPRGAAEKKASLGKRVEEESRRFEHDFSDELFPGCDETPKEAVKEYARRVAPLRKSYDSIRGEPRTVVVEDNSHKPGAIYPLAKR